MGEQEWLTATDPKPMLLYLLGFRPKETVRVQSIDWFPKCRASDRKLRLFACACYHRIRHLLPETLAQMAVEVAERVADGLLPSEELRRLEARLREPIDALEPTWRAARGAERAALLPIHEGLALGLVILWREAQKAAYYASSNAHLAVAAMAYSVSRNYNVQRVEEQAQTDLLRDIIGNPFQPFALDPTWLTPTVVTLAAGIYEAHAWDRLPILADSLCDAGCSDAELLAHLRGPGPHVRGCWAVDLVLGKE